MNKKLRPTFGHGKICYLELPSRDLNESSTFYHEIFDWHIRKWDDGSISFDDGVGEVSGVWRLDIRTQQMTGILLHIMIEDMTKTIQKIMNCGGKIVQGAKAGASEITAWFEDPSGNVFGLYQPRS